MKNATHSTDTKSGNALAIASRPRVDKTRRVNDLDARLGNALPHQPTSLAEEPLPDLSRTGGQLVAPAALRPRAVVADPVTPLSRVPSRASYGDAAHVQPTEPNTGGSVSNRKNPFRVALLELAEPAAEYGTKRAAFAAALPIALKALFLDEQVRDNAGLMREAAPWATVDPLDTNLYGVIRNLVESGHILAGPNKAGAGTSPYAFHLSSKTPFARDVSMATLAEAYFASDEPEHAKAAALTALRTLLGLPFKTRKPSVLRAASTFSCKVLHGLPTRLEQSLIECGTARKTAQNLSSALRAVIAFGLHHDLFPLYFPEWRPSDSFEAAIAHSFPNRVDGTTNVKVRQVRHGLRSLFEVLRNELAVDSIHSATSQDIVDAVAILAQPGRENAYDGVKTLRKLIRQTDGDWENPALSAVLAGIEQTSRLPCLPYLSDSSDIGAGRWLDDFVALLARRGFGEDWASFVRWYKDFSCKDDAEMFASGDAFPARLPIRELDYSTFAQRFSSIRAYLGVATSVFHLEPDQLSPQRVFGELFEPLTRQIRILWAGGVGTSVSHEASMGLHHIIYSGGLIAEALYLRSLHGRRLAPATRVRASGSESTDYQAEEIAPERTATERALFTAYRYAQVTCSQLKVARRRASGKRSGNTVKNLSTIVEYTPATLYADVQDCLLREVKPLCDLTRSLTLKERTAVVVAFLNGLFLSTGLRLSEPGTLRVGVQVPTDFWVASPFALRPIDRKNRKALKCKFRDAFLPAWFLHFYKTTAWPQLRKLGGLEATPKCWLFLSPWDGKPYTNIDENIDGTGRHPFKRKERAKLLARLWRRAIGAACRSLHRELPSGSHTVSPHCVRNAVGDAIYKDQGALAAAAFLGDDESVVRDVYGELDGTHVDSSEVLGRKR